MEQLEIPGPGAQKRRLDSAGDFCAHSKAQQQPHSPLHVQPIPKKMMKRLVRQATRTVSKKTHPLANKPSELAVLQIG